MLLNSIYGNSCNTCGTMPTVTYNTTPTTCGSCGGCGSWNNSCGCGCGNTCGSCGCGCGNNYGSNLGNAAYNFIGDWVNIVVTLTILQSILGLVCNWNCGCNNN